MEKKLNDHYIRMLRAILGKFCRQHPTRQQLYGYLPPITKTIKVRRTRHAGHCWRSQDEHISVLLWTPSHGWTKAGLPAKTYIQLLWVDTGCGLEELPGERWMIEKGDRRGSGRFVLAARYDDDDLIMHGAVKYHFWDYIMNRISAEFNSRWLFRLSTSPLWVRTLSDCFFWRNRHCGHCWRSKNELICDVLLHIDKQRQYDWLDVTLKTSRKQWTI